MSKDFKSGLDIIAEKAEDRIVTWIKKYHKAEARIAELEADATSLREALAAITLKDSGRIMLLLSKSEKLEKFTVEWHPHNSPKTDKEQDFYASYSAKDVIFVAIGEGHASYSIAEAQEIADNLQKVINYTKEQK